MILVDLDIETYSDVELKNANVYRYSESPEFEVLMCAGGVDDGPVEVIEGEREIVDWFVPLWDDPSVKFVAHNAPFERVCLSRALGMPVGEYLPPERWYDTQSVAAEYGLPRGLDALAKALKVTPKDTAGTRLINLFCMPRAVGRGKNKVVRRIMPEERPDDWRDFLRYCGQDVETMREVRANLPGWPSAFERDLWYADQRVNDRGLRVDLDLAKAAVAAAESNTAEAEREVIEVTGVENPGSTQQLGAWCESVGFPMENWQADTVKFALQRGDTPDDVRRVLELRQGLALVASKKYVAMLRGCSPDGRLRGQFNFHGAHTGRWSSRGVQVHNLIKKGFQDEDGERDIVAEDLAILRLLLGMGAAPADLGKLVRPTFLGPYVISDFSAIEARVLAWLSGEAWVLEAFVQGRDLYVETAERMGGGMGRPEGKIAVLAAGYQGSVGSFRNMGYGGRMCPFDTPLPRPDAERGGGVAAAEAAMAYLAGQEGADLEAAEAYLARARKRGLSAGQISSAVARHLAEVRRDPNHKCDRYIREIVTAWREANARIVQFWRDLEYAFWAGGKVGDHIEVEVRGGQRLIHLPSGRTMLYHGVHKTTRRVTDPETGEETERTRRVIAYRHIQGYIETTYGGRLTENVTQAVARDLLADALVRLDRMGKYIVSHVHDEVVIESDGGDLDEVTAVMKDGPAWTAGLPLDASGDLSDRYTK